MQYWRCVVAMWRQTGIYDIRRQSLCLSENLIGYSQIYEQVSNRVII